MDGQFQGRNFRDVSQTSEPKLRHNYGMHKKIFQIYCDELKLYRLNVRFHLGGAKKIKNKVPKRSLTKAKSGALFIRRLRESVNI